MSDLLILRQRFSSFFVNIKQYRLRARVSHDPQKFTRSAYRSLLSFTALLGFAKIALAQLFSFIFFKNE